jgi:TolA-binding protein
MKLFSSALLIAALAVPAFCQEPVPVQVQVQTDQLKAQVKALADQAVQLQSQADIEGVDVEAIAKQAAKAAATIDSDKIQEMSDKAAAMADRAAEMADKFSDLHFDVDINPKFDFQMEIDAAGINDQVEQLKDQMAFLQGPVGPKGPVGPVGPMPNPNPKVMRFNFRNGDAEYDAGTRALDQHKYDEAVQHFDAVITGKSPRADGALYWKAYALNRSGKRDEALAAIAQLRRDYASSAWLNDAQALEAEVKQSNGQPVSPAQETNDDLKLYAINSLMNADPDRAIPLLEGILKGSSAPNVKKNALFVLGQSKSPRAQQILADYAKGSGNPDLQLQAIQYVGQSGTKDAQQLMVSIYGTTSDMRVKSLIIQSLSEKRDYDALLNIAKTEKEIPLRDSAIRDIASSRNAPLEGVLELYSSADVNTKHTIVDGLVGRRDGKTLVDLAKKETDLQMKKFIVERLGEMRDNKDAMDYMVEIINQK